MLLAGLVEEADNRAVISNGLSQHRQQHCANVQVNHPSSFTFSHQRQTVQTGGTEKGKLHKNEVTSAGSSAIFVSGA
jgi:hypothetical protein